MKLQFRRYEILVLVLTVFLGTFLFLGCAALNKDKQDANSQMLEPQPVYKFSDIPVPNGFRQLPDSYSFESSGVRVAVLKFTGRANPDQVVNFYKEQMLMYNWNLLNVVEYGQRLMNFDRENETCVVSLSPKGNNVTLVVSVGPKSQLMGSKKARESKERESSRQLVK